MRSRYSAFVLCDQAYLLATWHEETRPSKVRFNDKHHWLGLRIYAADGGGEAELDGQEQQNSGVEERGLADGSDGAAARRALIWRAGRGEVRDAGATTTSTTK